MKNKTTITATGQTDAITLNRFDRLTFASIGDVDDYTLIAQVKLNDQGNWFSAQIMTDDTPYSTISGAIQVRFDCTALGTATTIDIEVSGAQL
ncbi:hypothetical protein KAR91_25330 [Candidatus Pacearchaeota archaeon]|nr:hypothetical protein [Candidatus Pacearchaeota archaeon]